MCREFTRGCPVFVAGAGQTAPFAAVAYSPAPDPEAVVVWPDGSEHPWVVKRGETFRTLVGAVFCQFLINTIGRLEDV